MSYRSKVIVFFSTCNSVKYHSQILNHVFDHPVSDIHGDQKQSERTATFFEFCSATSGTLLCTDVAARGLDIPAVDWIIQFDPPREPKAYIHRVGRTARAGSDGRAVLFLFPQELEFLKYLEKAKVPLSQLKVPQSKLIDVQAQLEKHIIQKKSLRNSARDAYHSYLQAYNAHTLKDVYDLGSLDLAAVAKSLGFKHPPNVTLPKAMRKRKVGKSAVSDDDDNFCAKYVYGQEATDRFSLDDDTMTDEVLQQDKLLQKALEAYKARKELGMQPI